MSVYITGGTLGFSLGPLLFAPFARALRRSSGRRCSRSPGWLVVAFFLTRVPPMPLHPSARRRTASAAPVREAAGLLYLIVVLRTLTSHLVRDVRAGDADAARPERRRRPATAVALYLFAQRHRRIPRRPGGGSVRARRRVIALSLVCASPFLFVAPFLSGWPFVVVLAIGGLLPAVDAAGQRDVRPVAGAGQRGDGVVADDGVRLGHRRPQRAARRHDRRPRRHRADAVRASRSCRSRGRDLCRCRCRRARGSPRRSQAGRGRRCRSLKR